MAPRLSKRQQRELDEISALAGSQEHDQGSGLSGEDDQHNLPSKSQIGAGFMALSVLDEASDDTNEDVPRAAKSRKPKKKKKKVSDIPGHSQPSGHPADQESNAGSPRTLHTNQSPPKNEKKALKKSKAKERKADKEDLDKVLAELSIKYPDLQRLSTGNQKTPDSSASLQRTLSTLLSVSLSHLDSEAEMRRFFGAKVVSKNKPSPTGVSGPSRRQPAVQRSHLAHVQPEWWPAKMREGLTMSQLNKEELELQMSRHSWTPIEDEKWWKIEYSKKYRSVTWSFMKAVVAGDPAAFWNILGKFPWHADSLLQVSEVYRYREEYAQAVDAVERALFSYERCFVGAFNFTSGFNRLDFDHVETRPFFMALHRQVTDLHRRGCIRTAFEFARLLYSLDPWTDPYGALLHLDYLSIKAGMEQWFFDVFDHFSQPDESFKKRINPTLLPGWNYARALALRIREDRKKDKSHESSNAALEDAIRSFPAVVPLLADKLDISLSAHIRGKDYFRIQTDASLLTIPEGVEHILANIYAMRSFSLWKDPVYCKWFDETVTNVCSTSVSDMPVTDRRQGFIDLYTLRCPTLSVYRHVIVQGDSFRRLTAFLPAEILKGKVLNCDPLPPPTYVSVYDDAFFKGADDLFAPGMRSRQERAADMRLLQRLIPDQMFRGQLEAIFEAHPQLAERFPRGLVQFVQEVARMPEDEINQMMIDQVMMNEAPAVGQEAGDGAMPGEMPEEDIAMLQFIDMGEEPQEGVIEATRQDGPTAADPTAQVQRDPADDDDEVDDDSDSAEEDIAPMPVRLLRTFVNRFWGRREVADVSDSSDAAEEGDVRDATGVD